MATEQLWVMPDGEAFTIQQFHEELDRLAEEIRWHEGQAQASARTALGHKVEIGRRLNRAKDILDHGEFLPWAATEFPWWNRTHLWNHMNLASNVQRVEHLKSDVSWREINRALKDDQGTDDGSDPEAPAGAATGGEAEAEPEPDALFWAARDGLLALRNEAQAQANRFGLECYPDDAGWGQLDELTKCVQEATDALGRLAQVVSAIRRDREERAGRPKPRRPRSATPAALGEQDRKIIAAIRDRGRATSLDISESTGIPVYVISARLSELKKTGWIHWTGKKSGAAFVYEVRHATP